MALGLMPRSECVYCRISSNSPYRSCSRTRTTYCMGTAHAGSVCSSDDFLRRKFHSRPSGPGNSVAVFNVVLVAPGNPPNTGNVIRLCANTGCRLHLVEPLGFDLSDAQLRRAGLDYAEMTCVTVHRDWAACRAALGEARLFALTTKASRVTPAPVRCILRELSARRCICLRLGIERAAARIAGRDSRRSTACACR
jgi:hypothetical protein